MKIEIILTLYDLLISGKKVSRQSFCVQNNISERTFYRYMREISSFLRKRRPKYMVDFSEREGLYSLKKI